MATITLTKEQIELLSRGEILTLELGCIGAQPIVSIKKEQKNWEPQGGGFHINNDRTVYEFPSCKGSSQFGAEYPTRKLAEKAAGIMHRSNRLLNYILENAPEHDPEGPGWHAYKIQNGHWIYDKSSLLYDGLSMPEDVCKEFCRRMNNGEVEL